MVSRLQLGTHFLLSPPGELSSPRSRRLPSWQGSRHGWRGCYATSSTPLLPICSRIEWSWGGVVRGLASFLASMAWMMSSQRKVGRPVLEDETLRLDAFHSASPTSASLYTSATGARPQQRNSFPTTTRTITGSATRRRQQVDGLHPYPGRGLALVEEGRGKGRGRDRGWQAHEQGVIRYTS